MKRKATGLATTVLAGVLLLTVGAGVALAAPGPIAGLTSPDLPNEASWYPDAAPNLSWSASSGVAGYASLLDQSPTTAPAATVTVPALRYTASTLTAGTMPETVESGDLNGDGKADLVVANYVSNTISVFLGKGSGTFAAKVDYAVGSNPHGLAIADLNGDGKPDVVVANWSGADVSVLLGNGDGTLKPAVAYATGANPSQVAIGDLNGDHVPDLAVAVYGVSAARVLLGNGDGTFQAATSYPTGTNSEDIAAADFNGDGKLDLAVADWSASAVSILLGNGDGSFAAKVDYAVGKNPHSVVAADFNGDGKLDLAVANWSSGTISVLSGKGDGTFGGAVAYAAGSVPARLVAADFNGDGHRDLAVVSRGSASVGVLLGKGDGTFMALRAFTTPPHPHGIVAADLNGDGTPDLAVACNDSPGTAVGVLVATPNAPFTAAYSGLADGVWYFHVRAIDTAGAGGPTATRALRIDTTPPVTTDDAPAGWVDHAVTVTLKPRDAASGMSGGAATTEYKVGSGPWTPGTAVLVPALADHSADGPQTISYRSTDAAGNQEAVQTATVHIDTTAPKATVKPLTLKAAQARKGKTIHLRVKIADPAPGAGSARLVVVLRNAAGNTLARYAFAHQATGSTLTLPAKLKRTLSRGTYSVSVRATDAAGNVQTAAAGARLRIV